RARAPRPTARRLPHPTLLASRWRPTSNGRSASPREQHHRKRRSDRHALVRSLQPLERRDQSEQDMISPDAVNFKISLGESLLLEAGFQQQSPRGHVLGYARSLQPVEGEGPEGEVAERADRGQRMAVAGERLAAPVADRAHL